uniref:ATP synthase F0 subunit 8 n=1 Tax=Carios capensis TaxID=176285 RepID=A0A1P8AGB2_CARC1|nr:ATP synthase F0 subunit 8 [Alectorobius capensis]AIZ58517.1 ATP synthase F0 subunit 8 [Alectorobius capensis]AMX74132.1 ATP synthase F0 subunit 8 [Alectorobius capensis]UYB78213.1 ATP synthase F0 subunit 8 [Alectorobius capensis]
MPQLFPMNWSLLTLFFSIILVISFTLIYFTYQPKLIFSPLKMKTISKNWKW